MKYYILSIKLNSNLKGTQVAIDEVENLDSAIEILNKFDHKPTSLWEKDEIYLKPLIPVFSHWDYDGDGYVVKGIVKAPNKSLAMKMVKKWSFKFIKNEIEIFQKTIEKVTN